MFCDLAALSPEETIQELGNFYFPPYISLAHIFNAPAGWAMGNRVLKQYALQYVIDGKAEFAVEGKTYTTVKGDLIVYRPYEVHSIHTLPGHKYISITIVFHFGEVPFPFENLFEQKNYLGNFANHPVDRQITELVAKYHQDCLNKHMECQGLLLAILSEASKHNNNDRHLNKQQNKNLARLVLIKNHIISHLDEDIIPEEMEKLSGLTWNYLILQFAQVFGYTPLQFLIFTRIAKAKELALNSTLSFGEIANQVGYKNIHSFGKIFKKKTGVSLSEFCASVYDCDCEKTKYEIIDESEMLSTNEAL